MSLGWIEYSDFGLDAYGSGFAASEDTIRKRPDMVKKFLRASYRGYAFAFANPEQAAVIETLRAVDIDRLAPLDALKLVVKLKGLLGGAGQ